MFVGRLVYEAQTYAHNYSPKPDSESPHNEAIRLATDSLLFSMYNLIRLGGEFLRGHIGRLLRASIGVKLLPSKISRLPLQASLARCCPLVDRHVATWRSTCASPCKSR